MRWMLSTKTQSPDTSLIPDPLRCPCGFSQKAMAFSTVPAGHPAWIIHPRTPYTPHQNPSLQPPEEGQRVRSGEEPAARKPRLGCPRHCGRAALRSGEPGEGSAAGSS